MGEESGAGFSYEAATESRLEEINARLASFAGLMALMAAHSSEDGDGQPSVQKQQQQQQQQLHQPLPVLARVVIAAARTARRKQTSNKQRLRGKNGWRRLTESWHGLETRIC